MNCEIFRDKDGYYVATVNGKEVTKQKNVVAASKKLYQYLKGQS